MREQLDTGDEEPGLRTFEGSLEVFCQAAIAVEPGDGALDHPSPRQALEAFGGSGTPDDLKNPGAEPGQRHFELAASIGGMAKTWRSSGNALRIVASSSPIV